MSATPVLLGPCDKSQFGMEKYIQVILREGNSLEFVATTFVPACGTFGSK